MLTLMDDAFARASAREARRLEVQERMRDRITRQAQESEAASREAFERLTALRNRWHAASPPALLSAAAVDVETAIDAQYTLMASIFRRVGVMQGHPVMGWFSYAMTLYKDAAVEQLTSFSTSPDSIARSFVLLFCAVRFAERMANKPAVAIEPGCDPSRVAHHYQLLNNLVVRMVHQMQSQNWSQQLASNATPERKEVWKEAAEEKRAEWAQKHANAAVQQLEAKLRQQQAMVSLQVADNCLTSASSRCLGTGPPREESGGGDWVEGLKTSFARMFAGGGAPAASPPAATETNTTAEVAAVAAAAADAAAKAAEQAVGARMVAMQREIDDQREALARTEAVLARERALREESVPVTTGVVVDMHMAAEPSGSAVPFGVSVGEDHEAAVPVGGPIVAGNEVRK